MDQSQNEKKREIIIFLKNTIDNIDKLNDDQLDQLHTSFYKPETDPHLKNPDLDKTTLHYLFLGWYISNLYNFKEN